MNVEQYPDPRAVEMAIKQAARDAHAADRSAHVNELIRQAYFDRLLCRVFSDGSDSERVL